MFARLWRDHVERPKGWGIWGISIILTQSWTLTLEFVGVFYRLHFWDKQISCCQLPRFTSRKWCGLDSIGPCTSADLPGLKHDFDRSKFLGSVNIFQSKSSKIFQFKVYLKDCAPNLQSLLLKPPTTGANIAWAAKNGLDVGQICQRPGRQNDMEIY